eukprot:7391492-Prymnesium_polylepis.3
MNRRCSSSPIRARYSPNVISPATALTSASRARTSLARGTTTSPRAAMIKMPIHSMCAPSCRLSGPAMIKLISEVTCRHAASMRFSRARPTTMPAGSSVYILSAASRV